MLTRNMICFSGGEIKRLSIARTLLKQADVYIFDESFSCIDEETRLRIFEKILNKLKGKIIIVISHDDSIEQYFNVKTVYI
ncbi:MAG: ATP-binding cassette domain-containing protein [Lachnospiraceae bacterium]|nr:ATP-binding cassette domain-containing protein [Lachnospiraceae bacterium]